MQMFKLLTASYKNSCYLSVCNVLPLPSGLKFIVFGKRLLLKFLANG